MECDACAVRKGNYSCSYPSVKEKEVKIIDLSKGSTLCYQSVSSSKNLLGDTISSAE